MTTEQTFVSRWLPFTILVIAVLYGLATGAFGQFDTALRVINEGADRFPGLDRFSRNFVKFWLSVAVPASLLLALAGTSVSSAVGRILIPFALVVFATWWGVAVFDHVHDDISRNSTSNGLISYLAYASHLGLPNIVMLVIATALIWCKFENEKRLVAMVRLALIASVAHAVLTAPIYLAGGWRQGMIYVVISLLVLPLVAGILRMQHA